MNLQQNLSSQFTGKNSSQYSLTNKVFEEDQLKYSKFFDEDKANREKNARKMTSSYYDLATDFYEYGQGQSFHFAPRHLGESLYESILRHEHYLAMKIGMKKGDLVLDAGCGIMGPARNISYFSGASIVGITINAYQVRRSITLNQKTLINDRLDCVQGDYTETNFDDNSFDHIYAIESFCHSNDHLALYKEMFRVLKPGGYMGIYDQIMTDKYDKNNPKHRDIKNRIEKGNGINSLLTMNELLNDLRKSGFEILEYQDLADSQYLIENGNDVSQTKAFEPGCSLRQFKLTHTGIQITQKACEILETIHIAPKGTSDMHKILSAGARALVESNYLEIFSPLAFFLCRKPNL